MMGTVGFVSSTLYRYAAVNLDQLRLNLGDDEAVRLALEAFVRSFVNSMPSGKQNTFCQRHPPCCCPCHRRNGAAEQSCGRLREADPFQRRLHRSRRGGPRQARLRGIRHVAPPCPRARHGYPPIWGRWPISANWSSFDGLVEAAGASVMDKVSVLRLRLAGPLQSWGQPAGSPGAPLSRSHEESVESSGLLAAAEGRRRSDPIEDPLGLELGVRTEQQGQPLRDFHTAHHQVTGAAMPLTDRFYWSDAVFTAHIGGDRELLEGLAEALKDPAYPLYFGRRACVPEGRIMLGH